MVAVVTLRNVGTICVKLRPILTVLRGVRPAEYASNMVLEVALIDVNAGSEADFRSAYAEARQHVAASSGVGTIRMTQGVETPTRFVLLIEWESVEAHDGVPAQRGVRTVAGVSSGRTSPAPRTSNTSSTWRSHLRNPPLLVIAPQEVPSVYRPHNLTMVEADVD